MFNKYQQSLKLTTRNIKGKQTENQTHAGPNTDVMMEDIFLGKECARVRARQ